MEPGFTSFGYRIRVFRTERSLWCRGASMRFKYSREITDKCKSRLEGSFGAAVQAFENQCSVIFAVYVLGATREHQRWSFALSGFEKREIKLARSKLVEKPGCCWIRSIIRHTSRPNGNEWTLASTWNKTRWSRRWIRLKLLSCQPCRDLSFWDLTSLEAANETARILFGPLPAACVLTKCRQFLVHRRLKWVRINLAHDRDSFLCGIPREPSAIWDSRSGLMGPRRSTYVPWSAKFGKVREWSLRATLC